MKSNLFVTTALVMSLCTGVSQAATILDPFSNGDDRVFGSTIFTTGKTDRLVVGFSGARGAVEINAETTGNGITDVIVTDGGVQVGFGSGSSVGDNTGLLRVIGDGTAGSATLSVDSGLSTSTAANGTIEIREGGTVSATSVQLGVSSLGDVNVIVDGIGSRLDATDGDLFLPSTSQSVRELSITNGGVATATGVTNDFDGEFSVGAGGLAVVDGAGSRIEFTRAEVFGQIDVTNGGALLQADMVPDSVSAAVNGTYPSLSVGVARFGPGISSTIFTPDDAEVNISGTSSVNLIGDVAIGGFEQIVEFDGIEFSYEGTRGHVMVEDNSSLSTTGDIQVSANERLFDNGEPLPSDGFGSLTVSSGSTVTADNVFVQRNGILDGNGGTIIADVILDGGIIAPGASPGIMNIDGDLEILDGLLQIEIAGTGAGMYDQLNITGDLIASLGFDIEISFLDSFVPQAGDVFNFLNVAGDSSVFDTPSLINFSVIGGGFFGNNAQLDFASGGLRLISDTSVAPVPLPAGFPMLLAGLVGLGWLGKRRKATSAA